MYNPTESFSDISKANVAQASKFAEIALINTEKLLKLNLTATKSAIAQSIESAQAVASVKDVQELFSLRTHIAETGVQTALAYSRTLY
jgi:phasin family protein